MFSLAGAISSVVPVKNNADAGLESITSEVVEVDVPSKPKPNNPSISDTPDFTISAASCAPVPCPEREMWFNANIPCKLGRSSDPFWFQSINCCSIASQVEEVTMVK